MKWWRKTFSVVAALCFFTMKGGAAEQKKAISYNRDIRPILSDNCFYCHGPDANKRKGKLRLDVREDALKKAIVEGKPDESELVKRIFQADPDELMPPPDSAKKLTPAQKDLLKRWIAQGAKYEAHWAYITPVKPTVPNSQNPIDALIQERLKMVGLKASSEADRRTIARRLYFDLIGLPPTPETVAAFESDKSPGAYTNLVEKLLASPQYGERMAIGWLDVVRFADTIGYHSDNPRNIWPYRDYVIKSFNENKPFDQFTREQLAGDLLPNSTQEQKVGSAFNRLLLSTEEGGAQPKDYEARMLTDRVRAVGTVWLGQTIGCAQCHDHKFDPIKQRDFYSMGAFFADIKEPIIGRREDGMLVPNPEQSAELARQESELAQLQKDFDGAHPDLAESYSKWEADQSEASVQNRNWTLLLPHKVKSAGGAKLVVQKDGAILAQDKKPDKDTYTLTFTNELKDLRGFRLDALPHDSLPLHGPGRFDNANFVVTEVLATLTHANGETQAVTFSSARASFEQSSHADGNPYKLWSAASAIDGDVKGDTFGWAILPEVGKAQQLLLEIGSPLTVAASDVLTIDIKQNHGRGSHTLGYFRLAATSNPEALRAPLRIGPPKEVADLLAIAPEKRDSAQKANLFAYFKSVSPELADLRGRIAAAGKAKNEYESSIPRCIVSVSDKPRTVRILPRGNFLIETGDIVEPALPAYLAGKADSSKVATRLDLANWIVSRDNPLTARVTVNRLWKQFFGTGLSKVLDDFGAQGEPPRNQALLDWLATEFVDSGWDIKHLVRLIVTSQTYKQSAKPSKAALAKDPFNRELASQSRWRVEAELVRDNALAISGLLVPKIGGPSVKPYQPDGYWENLNFPTRTWEASNGEDQYRRALYTWWQRSYMHPSLLAFDAPTREECVAERTRANIPQQALVLLNDPTYVEASRVFAQRILTEGGTDTTSRLKWAWQQALQRAPRADEAKTAAALLSKHWGEYKSDPKSAEAFVKVGLAPISEGIDKSELAAWTNVARLVLNLHETITRN